MNPRGGFLIVALLALANVAQAQTRPTDCSPTTANNAVCLTWAAVTLDEAGATITKPINYRVEQRTGAGAWATVAAGLTFARAHITGLAPGLHEFRVYAQCAPNCTESAASNVAGRSVIDLPTIPRAPVITIAVLISPDAPPTEVTVNGEQVYASVQP